MDKQQNELIKSYYRSRIMADDQGRFDLYSKELAYGVIHDMIPDRIIKTANIDDLFDIVISDHRAIYKLPKDVFSVDNLGGDNVGGHNIVYLINKNPKLMDYFMDHDLNKGEYAEIINYNPQFLSKLKDKFLNTIKVGGVDGYRAVIETFIRFFPEQTKNISEKELTLLKNDSLYRILLDKPELFEELKQYFNKHQYQTLISDKHPLYKLLEKYPEFLEFFDLRYLARGISLEFLYPIVKDTPQFKYFIEKIKEVTPFNLISFIQNNKHVLQDKNFMEWFEEKYKTLSDYDKKLYRFKVQGKKDN